MSVDMSVLEDIKRCQRTALFLNEGLDVNSSSLVSYCGCGNYLTEYRVFICPFLQELVRLKDIRIGIQPISVYKCGWHRYK